MARNGQNPLALTEEELQENIKYGFIVVTHLMTFLESFLNTILNRCLKIDDGTILRKSIDDKLELLCCEYKKEIKEIKDIATYQTYKRIRRVRNEMIHYKRTYVGESTKLPRITFGNSYADTVFTRKEMKRCINDFVKLADDIADVFGLKTYHNIPVITCDGMDGLVNYVYNPESINIDSDRDMNDSDEKKQWALAQREYNSLFKDISNEKLYEMRDNCYQRCRSIEKTYQYNSNAINDDAMETYHASSADLVELNKEIVERTEKSKRQMQMMLLSASGSAQLYPMIKRQKAFVTVNLYRNYEVMPGPQLIASCNVPYAQNTKLSDLFIQLGLGNQEFNIVDAETLQYIFINAPFYDDGETVYWNLRYDNITVDQYLAVFHCDEINVLPFDYHEIGGIGNAIPELFTELLNYANEFMTAQPFLGSILTGIIVAVICSGAPKCFKTIQELASRRANYPAMLKHLETKPEWDESEIMRKWKVDLPENLEFIMFGLGYIKKNGKYIKMK